MQKMEKRRSD